MDVVAVVVILTNCDILL